MKLNTKYLVLPLIFAFGCKKDDIPKGTPDCIRKAIDAIKADYVAGPPAKVFSYSYKGKAVYYIPAKCCDIPSILLDENCKQICSPDGGLAGTGDGKCPDFFKERSKEKLIWEDTRK